MEEFMIEALKDFLHKNPFESFRIVTESGVVYAITRSHRVAIGKNTILIYTTGDHFAFVRNNQITSVESTRTAA